MRKRDTQEEYSEGEPANGFPITGKRPGNGGGDLEFSIAGTRDIQRGENEVAGFIEERERNPPKKKNRKGTETHHEQETGVPVAGEGGGRFRS